MDSLPSLPMQDVLREIAEHMPGHASVWNSVRRAFEDRDAARARLAKVEPVVEAAEAWFDAPMTFDFRELLDRLEASINTMREDSLRAAEEVKP